MSFTPGAASRAAPPDLPVEEPVGWTDVADEPSPGPGLGTFEIHALGPSGAGKTVYMAALYAQMRIRRPSSTFHLRSDFASSSRLNAVYNEIQDIAAGWPNSTTVSAEGEFTACMRSDTGDFEPLRFRYLDYPGGILTNPRGSSMPEVQANLARLRSANA